MSWAAARRHRADSNIASHSYVLHVQPVFSIFSISNLLHLIICCRNNTFRPTRRVGKKLFGCLVFGRVLGICLYTLEMANLCTIFTMSLSLGHRNVI